MGRAPPPPDTAESQETAVLAGIDQFELQRSIITRLVKSSLPAEVKLQKEVAGALSKCATVFINYLAAGAHDNSVARAVKTISASDVITSLAHADLWDDELREVLEDQLEAYRTYGPRRPEPRSKKAKAKAASGAGPSGASSRPVKLKLTHAAGGAKGKGRASVDEAGAEDGRAGVRSEDEEEEEEDDEDDDDEEDEDEDEEEDEEADEGEERAAADDGAMDVDR